MCCRRGVLCAPLMPCHFAWGVLTARALKNKLVFKPVWIEDMKTIGAFEAKTHFSKLLSAIAHGEKFLITKNGKVVAMLSPATATEQLDLDEALQRASQLRQRLAKKKITRHEINRWRNEGKK